MRLDNFINLQHQIFLKETKKTAATEKSVARAESEVVALAFFVGNT